MKRSGSSKFPHSVQLFKFCQKVMMHHRRGKVRDQEVGGILNFNPSDCSHWKRGEKNVKSVFALAKLSETLKVEESLVHDVAGGLANLDEAYFEYLEAQAIQTVQSKMGEIGDALYAETRDRVQNFVNTILEQCEFVTPPLYLPEVMRCFAFVTTQPTEMIDKLSRILRVRAGQYIVHYRKGDLRSQTRLSMVKDLARIIFEGERSRFPELGAMNPDVVELEEMLFAANLLMPKTMLMTEMSRLDLRRNVVAELSTLFWVPKSLVCFQMQDALRTTMAEAGTRRQVEPSVAL